MCVLNAIFGAVRRVYEKMIDVKLFNYYYCQITIDQEKEKNQTNITTEKMDLKLNTK